MLSSNLNEEASSEPRRSAFERLGPPTCTTTQAAEGLTGKSAETNQPVQPEEGSEADILELEGREFYESD